MRRLREDLIRQSKVLSDYDRQKIKNTNISPIKPAVIKGGWTEDYDVGVKKISQVFLVINNLFLDSFTAVNPLELVLSNGDVELSKFLDQFLDQYKIEEPHYKPGSNDIRNLPIALAIYIRKITLALVGLLAAYPENKTARFILKRVLFVLTRFSFVIVLSYGPGAKRDVMVMCWFSGSALGVTGAWLGIGGVALLQLALTIFLGRTFTQQLFELLGSTNNPDNLKVKEDIDRLMGRSEDPEYWKQKIEQLLRPNSKSFKNPTDSQVEKIISEKLRGGGTQLNASFVQQKLVAALSFPFTLVASDNPFWELFPSLPESHLRWNIIISFTRLTLNQIWFIVWILIILEEIKQLEKKYEKWSQILKEKKQAFIGQPKISLSLPSLLNGNHTIQELSQKQLASIKTALIIDLNSRLNDLNDPVLQFIRVSKLYNVFYPKKAVSTSKNNFLSSKRKFVVSKITNVRTKVSNIRTKIINVRIKITNVRIENEKAADFISSVFGYISIVLGGLTTLFKPEFQESDRLKPLDDYQTGIRVERSIQYYEQLDSSKRISSENSETPQGIVLPGNYFGKSYILQGKSAKEVYSPQSTESPQFEIETFIEYEEEIPLSNGSSSISTNGNSPIVTSDPLVIDSITIEIETDLESGPININK